MKSGNRTDTREKAVVLLSGGIDSTTTLAIAISQGFDVYALSADYGQRHGYELEAAKRVAEAFGVRRHLILPLDLRSIGGSALTDDLDVPKEPWDGSEVPITYVPARNTILLSLALGWAEVLGAWDIFIGANAVDYSGYPDCRPQFLEAFEGLAKHATVAGASGGGEFRIHAPLIDSSKSDIIRTGLQLGIDYSITHSCYDPGPDGLACGCCDSCRFRLKGFKEAGVEDPIPYVSRKG